MVKCEECGRWFELIHWTHLRLHGLSLGEYRLKHPRAETASREMESVFSAGGV